MLKHGGMVLTHIVDMPALCLPATAPTRQCKTELLMHRQLNMVSSLVPSRSQQASWMVAATWAPMMTNPNGHV